MMQAPTARWGWLLAMFSVASLIEASFWSQMQSFTPLYLPKLGITNPADITAWTGAIVAISSIVGLPFLPFWGALADRYARQPVIVRSFVAHLLAGVLCVLAGNIWIFVIGRSIQSLSLGNSGLMMTTLSERVPSNKVAFALSTMNGAAPIGLFIGPLLGGPVVDAFGFPVLLSIDVVLLLGVILGMSFGYRDNFKGTETGSLMRMAADSVGIIMRSPRLRLLFPALFLLQAGWMLAFTYVSLVVTHLYTGTDPGLGTVIGIVLGASGLATLILGPILGTLADKIGYWKVLFAGAAASVVLWLIPFFTGDIVSFTVAWVAVSAVSSGLFALSFTILASSTTRSVRGRVLSFAYLPANLGYAVGPAIGSVVAQGNLLNIFPTAAVITALSIIVLAMASRTHVETEPDVALPGQASAA